MALLDSLLTAIGRADGDALVMHVGEKPYVVAPSGNVELSSRVLTSDTMIGMLAQLLPGERQQDLELIGAVEHDLPEPESGDRFTLVVARAGEDTWIEIRRHRAVPAADERDVQDTVEPRDTPLPSPRLGEPVLHWQSGATEPTSGIVVPMLRAAPRDPAVAGGPSRSQGLGRLLRLAATKNASTLYIAADSRPSIRVDGDIVWLEGEPSLEGSEVETLLLDLAPEPSRDALRSGMVTEWISDVADVGQVRCMSFRDHRGPGGIFRLLPACALSMEQLGLSREIQALTTHAEGLVIVTGRRYSGKSTLISAFVDLISRTRADHVITLETEIKFVHDGRRSFVSQREVRGGNDDLVGAARMALREDPDVLVLDHLRSPDLAALALDAADAGRLVIAAVTAPTSSAAVERLIDQFAPERRLAIQQVLSRTLLGVITQVLLRKTGGGRLAARELLLNTPPVANLIAEGKTYQLPLALDSGRRHGMVPLNDALAAFVQSGATDAREAYSQAVDKDGLLMLLRRAGIDTSFVERLA